MLRRTCALSHTLAALFITSAAHAAPALLVPDRVDRNQYGYGVGQTVSAEARADFQFRGVSGADLNLSLVAEDIDNPTEVAVWLNNRLYGNIAKTRNNGRRRIQVPLPGSSLRYGLNSLSFRQIRPGNRWGVGQLKLTVEGPRVVSLALDEHDPDIYGYRYLDQNDQPESARFSFVRTDENLHLFYTAYDIDSSSEVAVILNGREIGNLDETPNSDTAEGVLAIPFDIQKPGRNILEFRQVRAGNRWGISSILLSRESSCAYP